MIFADLEGALCRADLLDQTDSCLLDDCFKSENLLTKFCFQELSENGLLSSIKPYLEIVLSFERVCFIFSVVPIEHSPECKIII